MGTGQSVLEPLEGRDTYIINPVVILHCLVTTEEVRTGWWGSGVTSPDSWARTGLNFPQGHQASPSGAYPPPTPPLSWHQACPPAWDMPDHVEQPVPEKR